VIEHRLREIDRLYARAAPLPTRPRVPADDTLDELLAWRGKPRYPSRFGLPGAALRRLMLRMIRPYTSYQVEVNEQLLAALARAESRAQAVEELAEWRVEELHASLLSELRRHGS
jgi:hypothetical protein